MLLGEDVMIGVSCVSEGTQAPSMAKAKPINRENTALQ